MFKEMGDLKLIDQGRYYRLIREKGKTFSALYCAFDRESYCGSYCPHFRALAQDDHEFPVMVELTCGQGAYLDAKDGTDEIHPPAKENFPG